MEIEQLTRANDLARQIFIINESIGNIEKCPVFDWGFNHDCRLSEERLKELADAIRKESIGVLTAERDELQKQFDEL